MRILWIGKDGSGAGGDDVFDRKLLRLLSMRHAIEVVSPLPVRKAAKLANLARGVPIYRATYNSTENIEAAKAAVMRFKPDAVVISWEPFDFLTVHLSVPTVLLLHNVTSDAIGEVFEQHPLAEAYGRRISRWERRIYGASQVAALGVLSERDADVARALVPQCPVEVVWPGAPPTAPDPQAGLRNEFLISGTYDWYPKRRDLSQLLGWFANQDPGGQVYWDHPLPTKIRSVKSNAPVDPTKWEPALRIGLVPDVFESGFKLKVTHYVCNNCIVLSRSAIDRDYHGLPYYDIFIRQFRSMTELHAIVHQFREMDSARLLAAFVAFKNACSARFSWEQSAAKVESMVALAAAGHLPISA